MTAHRLKCWPQPFAATVAGHKRAEYRLDDRGFDVGDHLILEEFVPDEGHPGVTKGYTGRYVIAGVTHIERGPAWGIPSGYVCLSIELERFVRCSQPVGARP